MTTIRQLVAEFFKRRFPDKDLKFEKKCGYYYEWVKRFESRHPEGYMDEISLSVWYKMQQEGFKL